MKEKKRNSFLSIFITTLFILTLFSNFINKTVYAEDIGYDIDISSYPDNTVSIDLNGQTHSIPSEYTLHGVIFTYSESDKAYNATGLSDTRSDIYIGRCVAIKEANENIITIPINSIVNDFAKYNYNLLNVTININGKIGSRAFYNCINLSGLQITNTTYIGDGSFHGCKSLTGYIVIPDTVTDMISCFGNASNIEIGLNTYIEVEDEVLPTVVIRSPTITAISNKELLPNRSNDGEITVKNWISDVDYFYTTDGSDPLTSPNKIQMDGTNKIKLTAPDTDNATSITVKVQGKKTGYTTTNIATTTVNYNPSEYIKTAQTSTQLKDAFEKAIYRVYITNDFDESNVGKLFDSLCTNNNLGYQFIEPIKKVKATADNTGSIAFSLKFYDKTISNSDVFIYNIEREIPKLSIQTSTQLRDAFKEAIYSINITNDFNEDSICQMLEALCTNNNLDCQITELEPFKKINATAENTGLISFSLKIYDKTTNDASVFLYGIQREIPKLSIQTSDELRDVFNKTIYNINITNDFDESNVGKLFDSLCTNSNLGYQFVEPIQKVKATADNTGLIDFSIKFYDKTSSKSDVFIYNIEREIPKLSIQTSTALRDSFKQAIYGVNITNDFNENSVNELFDSLCTNSNLSYKFLEPFKKVNATAENTGSISFSLKVYDKTINNSDVFLYGVQRDISKMSNTNTNTTTGSAVIVTTTDELKKSYDLISDYLDDYKAKESCSKNKIKDKIEDLVEKYGVTISISNWDKNDDYLSFTVTIKDNKDNKRLVDFDKRIKKSSSNNDHDNSINTSKSINNNNNNSFWSDGGYNNCYDNEGKYKGTFIQSNGNGGILNIGVSGLKYIYVYMSDIGKYIIINDTSIVQNSLVIIPKGKTGIYYVSALPVESNLIINQGWLNDYYIDKDGKHTGWLKDNNNWYYLDETDKTKTKGWKQVNNIWYLFDNNGLMLTGWQQNKNDWYYFNSDGSMAHDTTIEGYNLSSNGNLI